jgi:hypothetical protein
MALDTGRLGVLCKGFWVVNHKGTRAGVASKNTESRLQPGWNYVGCPVGRHLCNCTTGSIGLPSISLAILCRI